MSEAFVLTVRRAAEKRILYLPHALDEMNAPGELITPDDVQAVIFEGDIRPRSWDRPLGLNEPREK